MSLDGFESTDKDAFTVSRGRNANLLFAAIDRTAKLLKVEVSGLENLPSGRALLVANHALAGTSSLR
jgi:hypothetical protein